MAESEKTMMKNCIFAHRLGAINCNLARSTVVVSSSEDQNHSRLYCTDRQLCTKTFLLSFSSHFCNLVFGFFGDEVTKILCNSLFTFFTEQGKTGKNGTHGNENLATYFWYFGSFDEKQAYENM